jgi:hypothetical protein
VTAAEVRALGRAGRVTVTKQGTDRANVLVDGVLVGAVARYPDGLWIAVSCDPDGAAATIIDGVWRRRHAAVRRLLMSQPRRRFDASSDTREGTPDEHQNTDTR